MGMESPLNRPTGLMTPTEQVLRWEVLVKSRREVAFLLSTIPRSIGVGGVTR
jgi:hypothetical protein